MALEIAKNYRDEDVTFFLHCYRDRERLQFALGHLRKWYPQSRLLLSSDDDYDPELVTVAKEHRAELTYESQRLFAIEHGGKISQRMLSRFFTQPTRWLIKIDTDTKICKRLSSLPVSKCLFGMLQAVDSDDKTRRIISIQGGCVGYELQAAKQLYDSNLLRDPVLADYRNTWARGITSLQQFVADTGRTSTDWTVGYCTQKLGIQLVQHPEVKSYWRRPVTDEGKFAVVHPSDEAPDANTSSGSTKE